MSRKLLIKNSFLEKEYLIYIHLQTNPFQIHASENSENNSQNLRF